MDHTASTTSILISDRLAVSQPQGVPTEHLLKCAHALLCSCIHCLLGTCAMDFTFLTILNGLCLAVCIWEIQHNRVTSVLFLTAIMNCLLLSSTKNAEHIQVMKVSDHVSNDMSTNDEKNSNEEHVEWRGDSKSAEATMDEDCGNEADDTEKCFTGHIKMKRGKVRSSTTSNTCGKISCGYWPSKKCH